VGSSTFLTIILICSSQAKSEQRACVITDEGSTVCGKLTNTNLKVKKSNEGIVNRKEIDKISVTLKGCKNINNSVKCDLTVRNIGVERNATVVAGDSASAGNNASKIIDYAGKTHYSSTVNIDNQSGSTISVKFSPDVDYAASVIFNNDRHQINKAQLLEIVIYSNSHKSYKFSNVSISS
jgi:hypothetical protein